MSKPYLRINTVACRNIALVLLARGNTEDCETAARVIEELCRDLEAVTQPSPFDTRLHVKRPLPTASVMEEYAGSPRSQPIGPTRGDLEIALHLYGNIES